ncbi:CRISPR-associated endonuclease Cas2 [Rheinheimera sediminis]|uniref:CRISPR-associated endonuclease Cas2 n=1 Tax=Rheinheimera sp. YQF-1 TaxID=2499626 RepID=UPI000FDA06A6|nr:CRISPR-associated endonuclease Cas2 [Rheinheimera sp. YQF-1]RVT47833.1 CRISPR-associated endonuclease Cas2 [Rheinheimera sp. YQF-1]
MRTALLVCYDIASNQRRRRLDLLLSQHGERLQYSVFELVVSDAEWGQLRQHIRELIDETTDSIHCYPLCRWCRQQIQLQGSALLPQTEGFVCVG